MFPPSEVLSESCGEFNLLRKFLVGFPEICQHTRHHETANTDALRHVVKEPKEFLKLLSVGKSVSGPLINQLVNFLQFCCRDPGFILNEIKLNAKTNKYISWRTEMIRSLGKLKARLSNHILGESIPQVFGLILRNN